MRLRNIASALSYWALSIVACNRHDTSTRTPAIESSQSASPSSSDVTAVIVPADTYRADASTVDAASSVVADAGAPARSPDLQQHAPDCRVLAVGDSLTDTRSGGGGYLKAWASKCPRCQFTNIGRGGAMVNQMLPRLRQHLQENPSTYSHIVVFGGVNDLYSDLTAHRTLARIERDLSKIYQLARSRSKSVIAMTVAPWGGFRRWYTEDRGRNTQELNQWITQSKARGDTDFVVVTDTALSCGDPMQLCPVILAPFRDGLHFGAEGHRRLGAALLETLGVRACDVASVLR